MTTDPTPTARDEGFAALVNEARANHVRWEHEAEVLEECIRPLCLGAKLLLWPDIENPRSSAATEAAGPLAARVAELEAALEDWERMVQNAPTIAIRNRGAAAILRRLAAARALLPPADGSRVERQPFDEADAMCPNCQTPWKCNGPHLNDQTPWALRQTGGDA
jgi:hypothetical protein